MLPFCYGFILFLFLFNSFFIALRQFPDIFKLLLMAVVYLLVVKLCEQKFRLEKILSQQGQKDQLP